MSRRRGAMLAALMVLAVAAAGCGGREATDAAGGPSVEVLALRPAMTEAVASLEELVVRINAGSVAGGRQAYQAFARQFGEVLGPISLRDVNLAKEIANANTALKELMGQARPDKAAVAREADLISSGLNRAAEAMGLSLTTSASAEIGAAHNPKRKEIIIRAKEYGFEPKEVNVEAGTEVTVKLMNVGTMKHEWELEALDVEIEPIAPNTTAQVTFTVTKPGRYEYVCDVDDHDERGMKGTLIVR